MGRRNRKYERDTRGQFSSIYLCADRDCAQFGVQSHISGECWRCHGMKLSKAEWEHWNGYLGSQGSADSDLDLYELDARLEAKWDAQAPTVPVVPVIQTIQVQPAANDTWDAPPCLAGCPIAPKANIYVPADMFQDWIDLAKEFSTEWIAYLQGKPIEGKPFSYEVTGMVFPEQSATPAHVEVPGNVVAPPGTIASVHSHVGMDVFFSAEDVKHFNWPVELVVNRKGEIKANGLTMLECGRPHRGDATVWLTGREAFRSLANVLKDKLVVERHAPTQSVGGQVVFTTQTSSSAQSSGISTAVPQVVTVGRKTN